MINRHARNTILLVALLFSIVAIGAAQEKEKEKVIKKTPIQHTSPAKGEEMYMSYCAVCHGKDGKGNGPAASALKVPPPDLTTLAQRHDGKYPNSHVATILRHGAEAPAHGTSDMPVWGPLFRSVSRSDDAVVMMRISNLNSYLESLQAK
jgi:mono/diheme cytochrome c family protein